MEISEDKSFTARYPAEQPVELRITMRDGTVHTGRCIVTRGEPANPHSLDEVRVKFFELGESVWSKQVTASLHDGLMKLESIANFGDFAEQLELGPCSPEP